MITEREEKLWGLLDDIDTLSDVIKPSTLEGYEAYYARTQQKASERHDVLYSDGYRLHESAPQPSPGTAPTPAAPSRPLMRHNATPEPE